MELPVKFILAGVVLTIGTILIGFVGFQTLVEFVVKDQVALRTRNEMRGIYLKIPFPLNFKIYFFNVSNPEEVQNGAMPILKEVGPYHYEEYKEKINVIDNDAEDSLQYDAFDTYKFNKTLSGNLSDEDYVTIINPLLVGMVNTVSASSPALLSIVNQAIGHLFNNPTSIFLTDKVKNILFEGMEINCQGSDFASKAVCTQLKSTIPGVKESLTKKNVLLFSLIGGRNATIADTVKIMRGIKNYKDLGRVLEVNGKKEIGLWGSEDCNRFKGTDGWIIPPLLKPEEGIKCYTTHLCRNIALEYVRDDVIRGIHIRRYEANLGDQQNNEADKCYCPTPRPCLKKGVFELSKCLGAPIMATLPHFLDADETLLTQVKGLNPVRDDHVMNVNIDPMTSAPIKVRIRIQMNLEIAPNSKVNLMNNLTTALHPMFWLEDGLDLEGPLFVKITNIFTLLKMAGIMKWIILVASLGILAYGGYTHFKNSKTVKITPVHQRAVKDDNAFNRSTNELIANMRNEGKKGYSNNNIMSGHEFDRYK